MKNIWKILNIEPTKDVNEIKRAYTALAHQINPEEEPDKSPWRYYAVMLSRFAQY